MPRGRKANDGRGRLGGRQAGTPNKDNPLKNMLHDHSVDYFTQNIAAKDVDLRYFIIDPEAENAQDLAREFKQEFVAQNKGRVFSRYELDLLFMSPSARAKVEIDLLAFHTPKIQAISADMSVKDSNHSFTLRLARLANGEDISADE
ncbi:MAG: hypothetical protein J6X59_00480 [Bacteroidales bacterium]|nr:hypothetical protein [Bacteroidales bacterium]